MTIRETEELLGDRYALLRIREDLRWELARHREAGTGAGAVALQMQDELCAINHLLEDMADELRSVLQ